ncbi:MAG: hypothetical protein N2652_07125 [Kiritimatiellae bacterium]|nr:hypothetical protein [Kiritimatiellia bacterium]
MDGRGRRAGGHGAAVCAFVAAVAAMSVSAAEKKEAPTERKPSWLPSRERALFVCVVQDEVTLSWHSERGRLYTILYTDKPSGDAIWSPLPGYVRMPGTGRTETLKFKVDPLRPRRFNLRVEEAAAVPRLPRAPGPAGK